MDNSALNIYNADMEKRYIRNMPTISESGQETIRKASAAIIGCGGLGGFLCEYAARLGFSSITVCDGDSFEETNLNRQLLSNPENTGSPKALSAAEHIQKINPDVNVRCFNEILNEANYKEILAGCSVILDGLDSVKSRLILENAASELNIPLIHGAINGWTFQVSTVLPNSGTLHKLYGGSSPAGVQSNIGPVAGACAGFQMAEAIKVLTGEPALSGKLLLADMQNFDFVTLDI